MAARQSTAPKINLSRVAGRPIQMWYRDEHGNKVRRSSGTYDVQEATEAARKWEAVLVLGLPETRTRKPAGPQMAWSDFREAYRTQKAVTMKPKAATEAESRLDLATRILRPKTLQDVADGLDWLQADMLAGKCSRYQSRPRSRASVQSNMRAIIAALNWAAKKPRQWVTVPKIELVTVPAGNEMKGRPLCGEELDRYYTAMRLHVGERRYPSWRFFVAGVLASGLRLSEMMVMSWDRPQTIRPVFRRGALPEIAFPAHLQKNSTQESIPMTPWFAELLQTVPEEQRTDWVFNPLPHHKSQPRLHHEHVGKILSTIGKAAGVIVDEGNPITGAGLKYASCHDLRRTFATKLAESKVEEAIITKIMRHSSADVTRRYYISTRTQSDAGRLWESLGHMSVTQTVTHGQEKDRERITT